MNKQTNKGSQKATLVFSAVLILLGLAILAYCLVIPVCNRYYVNHVKYQVYGGMKSELRDGELFKDLQSGRSICFLGDSITDGTETDGIGWYQPLVPYTKGDISRLACGGWMVHHLINEADNIPGADIYVVGIGVNDVVFPWGTYASQTPEEYTDRLEKLSAIIRSKSPNAKIYFIAPWTFTGQYKQYEERGDQFRAALAKWCERSGVVCIDPHPYISSVLKEKGESVFMRNDLHPNSPQGIGLYSYAVLKADHSPSG
jgi:lysophospholipase L1-like esterase